MKDFSETLVGYIIRILIVIVGCFCFLTKCTPVGGSAIRSDIESIEMGELPDAKFNVEIDSAIKDALEVKTTMVIEPYFTRFLWVDNFSFGCSGDDYVVKCRVRAENRTGFKDAILVVVYYELIGTDFEPEIIVVGGDRYK
jgi:hypothetical protein